MTSGRTETRSVSSQRVVDGLRRVATLADRPHHEGRTAPQIASGEDTRDSRSVRRIGRHQATGLTRDTKLAQQAARHRSGEADGEEHEIRAKRELRAR